MRFAVFIAASVALISAGTNLIGYSSLGLVGVDMNARFSDRSANDVVLVVLTRDDDAEYFGGRRPFDPGVLDAIIRRAIELGGAAALGLDISTSAAFYRDSAGPLEASARREEVVWSHWWRCEDQEVLAAPTCPPSERPRSSALGGMDSISQGLAQFVVDPDLRVRKFRRTFRSDHAAGGAFPSFATAVVRAAGIDVPTDDTRDRWIDRVPRTGFLTLTLDEFMTLDSAMLARPDGELRGRIVMFGGGVGQDVWATSSGFRSGLSLWAQIVATETAAARANTEPELVLGRWPTLGLDVAVGSVAAVIAHLWIGLMLARPSGSHGSLLAALGLVLLLLLSAAATLLSPWVWLAFFAPMFGVGVLSRTITRAFTLWGEGPTGA